MKIIGHLDLCGPSLVEGWLYCDAPMSEPLRLQVFVGGELLGECVVDRFRQDLLDAGYGDGNSGFSFSVPMDRLVAGFGDTKLRIVDSIVYVLPDETTVIVPGGTNGFVQISQPEAEPDMVASVIGSRKVDGPLRRGGAIFRN